MAGWIKLKENEMNLQDLQKQLFNHGQLGLDAIYDENKEALKFHNNAMDEIHRLIEKLKGE